MLLPIFFAFMFQSWLSPLGGAGFTPTPINPSGTACTVGVSVNLTYTVPVPVTYWGCSGTAGSMLGTYQQIGNGSGASIPHVTTLIKGNGGGNGADSGIDPTTVITTTNSTTIPATRITGAINATTINGGTMPASAPCVGTNSSSQPIPASCSTGGASTPATTAPLKGNGSANGVTAAIQGVDFQAPFGLSAAYYGNFTTSGIAGAVTACGTTVSCSVIVPPSYGTTEAIPGFSSDINNPGSSIWSGNNFIMDYRYGLAIFGNNNFGYHQSLQSSPLAWQMNYTQNPGANVILSTMTIIQNSFDGGSNTQNNAVGYGNKTTYNGLGVLKFSTTPGQHIGMGVTTKSNTVGDALGLANYVFCAGGLIAQADEGCEAQDNQVIGTGVSYAGTLIGTPSTGATSITISPTQGALTQGAGRFIIRTNAGTVTGTVTNIATSGSGPTMLTGTNFPVSTVIAQAGTVVPTPGVHMITPNTYTVGSVSGFSTSSAACIADNGNFEMFLPTLISGANITASFQYVYSATAIVSAGGVCGLLMDLLADEVTSTTFPANTFFGGVPSGTTLRFAWPMIAATSSTSASMWVAGGGAYQQLTSRWTSSANGYKLYPSAKVTSVQTGGGVSNTLTLAANNVAWASADTVEELVYPAVDIRPGNNISQGYYPHFPTRANGFGWQYNQPLTNNDQGLAIGNMTPLTMYQSGGGTYPDTHIGGHWTGLWGNGMVYDYAPAGGLLIEGCGNGGCTHSSQNWARFSDAVGGGSLNYILHDEVLGGYNFEIHGGGNGFDMSYDTAASAPYFGPHLSGFGEIGSASHLVGLLWLNGAAGCLQLASGGMVGSTGSPCGTSSGGVTGPGSSVNGNLAGWTGTTGTSLNDSGIAPSSLVNLTGTQSMTSKTVDGVSPTTFGYVDPTSSIQTQLNGKQQTLTLSTTGTSGAATLSGGALNIPNYTGGLSAIGAFTMLANDTNASATPTGNSALNVFGILGDDQTNAVGLGTAASLRKTIYTDHVAGITIGAGQTTGTRTATCTALQAVFNDAATNNLRVQIVPGIYEIDCAAGLLVTNTNDLQALTIRGSQQARIIQFHSNAPGLTVGDTANGASDYSINVDMDGLRIEYGVSQTGNTAANLFQVGAVRSSTFKHFWLGADGVTYTAPNTPYQFPAYRPFYLVAGATSQFSNTFSDFFIQGAQYRLLDMSTLGTNSIFDNFYVTNGYFGQPGLVSDCAWYMPGFEGNFRNINIEAVMANVIINGQTLRGAHFGSIHLETIQLIGANPQVWEGGTNRMSIDDMDVSGFYLSSGTLNTQTASGTGVIFSTYQDDALKIGNLNVQLQNSGDVVNLPLEIFNPVGVGDQQPSIEATNISVDDFVSGGLVSHIFLDNNTPAANFAGFNRISHYKWGAGLSHIDGAVRPITGTYMLYGQDTDPTIQVPASITSFTLTLADINAASGTGATSIPKVGNIVHVRRDTGTASGTLTIADAGAGTISTNTTAAVDLYYKFDGLRYRLITDSTSFASGGGSMVYPGAGIPLSTGSAWGTSYSAQGTDSKLLTAGTVAGTSASLCTDGAGGATTTGCPSGSLPSDFPLVLAANSIVCDGVTDQTTAIQTLYSSVASNNNSGYNTGDIIWPTNCGFTGSTPNAVVISNTIVFSNGLSNQIKGGPVLWKGHSVVSTGSTTTGGSSSITFTSGSTYATNQWVWIAGAGCFGSCGLSTQLVTNTSGLTWTLANAATAAVTGQRTVTNPVFIFSTDRNVKVSGFTIRTANSSTYPMGNAFEIQQDLSTAGNNSELDVFENNFVEGSASGGLQDCFAFVSGSEQNNSDNSGHELRNNSCNNFSNAAVETDNSQETDLNFIKNTFHANGISNTQCYLNLGGAGITAMNNFCSGTTYAVWNTTSQVAHPLVIIDGVDEANYRLMQVIYQDAATPISIINERFSYNLIAPDGVVINNNTRGPLNIIGGSYGQGTNTRGSGGAMVCGTFNWTNSNGGYGQISGVTNSAFGCQGTPMLVAATNSEIVQFGNVYTDGSGNSVPPTVPDVNHIRTVTRNGTTTSAACDERYDAAGSLWYYVPATGTGILTPTSTKPANCP